MNRSKLSVSNIILIVICLVVVMSILLMNVINTRNLISLRSSIDTLNNEMPEIGLLRNTGDELMQAENKYRIFLSTGDTSFRDQFLKHISNTVENLNLIKSGTDSNQVKEIIAGLNKKVALANMIVQLKHLSDSVTIKSKIVKPTSIFTAPIQLKKIDRSIIKAYMVSRVDTMKAVTKKKGFFKKLGALFSSKNDDEIKYVKGGSNTKNGKDSAESALDSNITQLTNDIQNYYQRTLNKEVDIRKKINDSEKQLAETNLSIVNQISASLKNLLQNEENIRAQLNVNAFNNAISARDSIQKLFWISLLIILFIVGLLVYNIFKMVNYEKEILEARESAEKLAQVKSRFLSNMSHEIRSPLTSIMGFTELIDKVETDPEKKNFLEAIKTSSEHLLSTVNDVLDFSKLDAGKLKLEKKPFLLSKAIQEVVFALSSTSAAKKQITIHTEIELDANMVVNGDLFRLKQILYNLISNAIKFTDHGSVTIHCTLDSMNNGIATIKMMVTDTGIGIPVDHINTIFDEFTQVASDSSRKENRRAIKGTGLGLSICKMLVELQGGSISVESNLHQGSTFSFTLPYQLEQMDHVSQTDQVNQMDHVPDPVAPIVKTTSNSLVGKKALVIEDNDVNIMLLTLLLKKLGLMFDVAKDGADGLEKLKTFQYDIVLTDINVPKLTGDQFALEVRKLTDPTKLAIPIIALTATIMRDDIDAYLQSGINDILVKPFRQMELRNMLEKYVLTT